MKKVLLLGVAALFIISCGSNAKETTDNQEGVTSTETTDVLEVDTVNAPIVTVENDTYSFGEVVEGEKVMHEYSFTNTGKTPLIISSVNASCGCTTPNYPKEPVKPGETAKIEVVFNSQNQPGVQHKVITMTSNAHPQQTIFHLRGEVKKTEKQ